MIINNTYYFVCSVSSTVALLSKPRYNLLLRLHWNNYIFGLLRVSIWFRLVPYRSEKCYYNLNLSLFIGTIISSVFFAWVYDSVWCQIDQKSLIVIQIFLYSLEQLYHQFHSSDYISLYSLKQLYLQFRLHEFFLLPSYPVMSFK